MDRSEDIAKEMILGNDDRAVAVRAVLSSKIRLAIAEAGQAIVKVINDRSTSNPHEHTDCPEKNCPNSHGACTHHVCKACVWEDIRLALAKARLEEYILLCSECKNVEPEDRCVRALQLEAAVAALENAQGEGK